MRTIPVWRFTDVIVCLHKNSSRGHFITQPRLSVGSGQLPLFRTIATSQNQQTTAGWIFKCFLNLFQQTKKFVCKGLNLILKQLKYAHWPYIYLQVILSYTSCSVSDRYIVIFLQCVVLVPWLTLNIIAFLTYLHKSFWHIWTVIVPHYLVSTTTLAQHTAIMLLKIVQVSINQVMIQVWKPVMSCFPKFTRSEVW